MGFFDALRRALGGDHDATRMGRDDAYDHDNPPAKRAESWAMDDGPSPEFADGRAAADPAALAEPPRTSGYDVDQWHRKLKHVLERLPAAQGQFPDLVAEARALGIDREVVEGWMREEFALMVRRAVSNRLVTFEEHRKLDLARRLMGIPDADAEAILHDVTAEAESFFGTTVEGMHEPDEPPGS